MKVNIGLGKSGEKIEVFFSDDMRSLYLKYRIESAIEQLQAVLNNYQALIRLEMYDATLRGMEPNVDNIKNNKFNEELL